MKNNFRFILPRLAGATLLIGLAAFVMLMVLKLLIGIIAIGVIVALIRHFAGRTMYGRNAGRYGKVSYGVNPLPGSNPWMNGASANVYPQSRQTIIPIS